MKRTYRSVIIWPKEVSCGNQNNSSTDEHYSKGQAEAVVRGIFREGLGGEGKIFPIFGYVEPITDTD